MATVETRPSVPTAVRCTAVRFARIISIDSIYNNHKETRRRGAMNLKRVGQRGRELQREGRVASVDDVERANLLSRHQSNSVTIETKNTEKFRRRHQLRTFGQFTTTVLKVISL
jgi:hypothetical protein